MSKQITLNNTQEIITFFEEHPALTFNQMQNIINAYTGNKINFIVFTEANKENDLEVLKDDLIQWLKDNAEALDKNKLLPIPFLTTYRNV